MILMMLIDKLKTIPADLSMLSNVVKNDVVKKTLFDELVKKVNAIKTFDASDLVKKADYNTRIENIEKKIPDDDTYIQILPNLRS